MMSVIHDIGSTNVVLVFSEGTLNFVKAASCKLLDRSGRYKIVNGMWQNMWLLFCQALYRS